MRDQGMDCRGLEGWVAGWLSVIKEKIAFIVEVSMATEMGRLVCLQVALAQWVGCFRAAGQWFEVRVEEGGNRPNRGRGRLADGRRGTERRLRLGL